MSDKEEGLKQNRDQIEYRPQLKVRTNLQAGANSNYTDMSGVCNGTPPTTGAGYYPDMSGVCNTGTVPPTTVPPTSGGGYVNGTFYPDMSGTCA